MMRRIFERATKIREKIRLWWWNARREFPDRVKEICWEVWFWPARYWKAILGIAIAVLVITLIWIFWCVLAQWIDCLWTWSRTGVSEVSKAETLRNLVLAIGGGGAAVIGLLLAIWRSGLAHLQTKTAERNLNNERYQKGAEMLGSETLATRMGGVYALENLARERPYDYHIQITKLLCAFIRHPTGHRQSGTEAANGEGEGETTATASVGKARKGLCSPAIEAAAQVLGKRSKKQIRIERHEKFELELREVNLSGANLSWTYLSGAHLEHTALSGANLWAADLSGANLSHANLPGAVLWGTALSGARLWSADLSGAELWATDLSDALLAKANLSGADLRGANLSGADLRGVDLSGAYLYGADLSGAGFGGVTLKGANLSNAKLGKLRNLTQAQLDDAFIWKGYEPSIPVGAVDSETGKPLKWQGEVRPAPIPPTIRPPHAPEKTAD